MILLTVRLTGRMVYYTIATEGYTDREDRYKNIISKTYYLFGKVRLYSKVVFTEQVPNFAAISNACLGSTDWKSSQPDLIDRANRRDIVKVYSI